MFHNIPENVKQRMEDLEDMDSKDRIDGTPRLKRLRQIPPETGKFISILAASAPKGEFIEIGTSAGYSTLWIALTCKLIGSKVTTFEILQEKINKAKITFRQTNMEGYVELIEGDARDYLIDIKNISFCFLDAEKEVYEECYDLVIPNMVKGGLLIADNAINHYETLKPMIDKALSDQRLDALVVPIGKGELLCRKL
ncbi:MAG: class I SAM-dependent methyltransferase [Candidatus Lokiarchaeota archaeon]|nr:class I SAM-dependent methyltransferase [Candidatus Lokiarchaeota archaeon]